MCRAHSLENANVFDLENPATNNLCLFPLQTALY